MKAVIIGEEVLLKWHTEEAETLGTLLFLLEFYVTYKWNITIIQELGQ